MWYLPENARGVGTASDQFRKTAETAPAGQADYCTCIEVYGRYFDASEPAGEQTFITTYRLFLGENNKTDYNLLRNHSYTVNTTLRGRNEMDTRIECVLNPANCYMVSEPSTEYIFNATIKGNGARTPISKYGHSGPVIVPERLSPDDALLLWETGAAGDVIEPGSVKLSEDKRYISFRTSSNIGGNAVIAALKKGEVIWSWHIWSTEYDPETSYDIHVTRTINKSNLNHIPSREIRMMKVNLGAASLTSTPGDIGCYGLYYQWGRKDPFIGRASVGNGTESTAFQGQTAMTTNTPGYEWKAESSSTSTIDGAIPRSIAMPTTFFATSSTLGDWLTSIQNTGYDNLWGNPYEINSKKPNAAQGSKSIYDPCPAGWRVPPHDTWTMFSTTGDNEMSASKINAAGSWDDGWYFYCMDTGSGPTSFYPATGARYSRNGTITSVTYGLYWTSSPMNYYGGSMCIGSTRILPYYGASSSETTGLRASGNSVRCAKEE